MSVPAIAVVVVTYNSAAPVRRVLESLAEQVREDDDLVVVDNGSTDGTAAAVRADLPRARVLEQRRNLGFAAACHLGVDASQAPLVMFLNPDAVPAPGALDALRACADRHPGWGAWQALVTMPGGEAINTSGGVAHFLGMGWAGQCGEPVVRAPAEAGEVGFASGAAMVIRRGAWNDSGGFDERYFMYGEDLDLSLRLRLAGLRLGIEPAARVDHEYEFSRNERKWLLLERNRWWTILSVYPGALLLLLAPALAMAELALLGVAAEGGWLRAKLNANASALRALPAILRRRRAVQRTRVVTAGDFADGLSAELDNPYLGPATRQPALVAAQRAYWRAVCAVLAALGSRAPRL